MTTRRSIKTPITQIFQAAELMSLFADAHLAGQIVEAERFLQAANNPDVWNWTNPHWDKVHLNPRYKDPLPGDTIQVAKDQRDPRTNLSPNQWRNLIERDGFHCRYCGIPVIHDAVRKWLTLEGKKGAAKGKRPYEAAVPWNTYKPDQQHAALQCLWIQADHVVPLCHGGRNDLSNLVISCALCNFGKWNWTLRQLDILDPRDFPPLSPPERRPTGWDGLSRLVRANALSGGFDCPRGTIHIS